MTAPPRSKSHIPQARTHTEANRVRLPYSCRSKRSFRKCPVARSQTQSNRIPSCLSGPIKEPFARPVRTWHGRFHHRAEYLPGDQVPHLAWGTVSVSGCAGVCSESSGSDRQSSFERPLSRPTPAINLWTVRSVTFMHHGHEHGTETHG